MLSEKTAGLILSQREARSTQAGSGFVSSANAFLILNTALEGRLEVVLPGRGYGRNRNRADARDRIVSVEFLSTIMKTSITGLAQD
jgi:hypothetical protein